MPVAYNPHRPDGSVHEYCPPEQPEHVAAEMDRLINMHHAHTEAVPEVEAAWLHVGSRSLPVVGLPHLCPPRSATALLEAGVPPVRSTPGQRPRQENRSKLPHQGVARVEEDQDGLAGPELHYGSGRPDPASFDPGHRPSGSASTSKLEPQGSPLTAPPLKVVPGASYGVLLDRRHEVHPQVPVMRGSFPRLFGRPPSAASSPIRETLTSS